MAWVSDKKSPDKGDFITHFMNAIFIDFDNKTCEQNYKLP